MSSAEMENMPFMSKFLWFSGPGLFAYFFGNTLFILEILCIFVVGNNIKQKDYESERLTFSITFGAFTGSTIGHMYNEEPFTWSMICILLMLVWFAKESNYSKETSDLVVRFVNTWFYMKIALTALSAESYILKVLPLSVISAFVKYTKFKRRDESEKDMMKDTLDACVFGALFGLIVQMIQKLVVGKELLPEDDRSSVRTVVLIILLIYGYKQYKAVKDESVKECFICCFIFLSMALLLFAGFIIHPLFMVLIFPMTSAFVGLSFHDQNPETSKKLTDYIFGPCCFSTAAGLLIWKFKDFMEVH